MHLNEHIENFWRSHGGRFERTPGYERVLLEVNQRIDQFAHFDHPDQNVHYLTLFSHRRYLHHREWIDEYAAVIYGEIGRAAAEQHVLDDCGHVPHAVWYWLANGPINELGQLKGKGP